jgi:hypothetical protein
MPWGSRPGCAHPDWWRIPASPIDVFAVSAVLVERSGAYRAVIAPAADGHDGDPCTDHFCLSELRNEEGGWPKIAKAWSLGLFPEMTQQGPAWDLLVEEARKSFPTKPQDEIDADDEIFNTKYHSFETLREVDLSPLQQLWIDLYITYGSCLVVSEDGDEVQDWWAVALKLMILSDMASAGVGFRPRRRGGRVAVLTLLQKQVLRLAGIGPESWGGEPDENPQKDESTEAPPYVTTLTTAIDRDFCAVLPKTRTASVGCTLRSLSHNLALLPSPGLVEARWRVPGTESPSAVDTGDAKHPATSLNLLLIPFPYRISSKCFVGRERDNTDEGWSYFEAQQGWLSRTKGSVEMDIFVRFFDDLVKDAANNFDKIHGVVFPELSLDPETFEALSEEFRKHRDRTGFEFIVAGLGGEPRNGHGKSAGKRGNFVAVRGVSQDGKSDWDFNNSREKHHRWKLNKGQIHRYGLSSSLASDKNWWEGIPLGRRRVEFFEPRAGTSMTVLICEDLARADPCQTVVRSIGPNLVLALLMDGPQRKFRWPGHYAGVLADDPGSAVLTLTSFGLIERGLASDESQSRSIALFRNSLGEERELFLPSGFHALAVRLQAVSKAEHTLDGRSDGESAYNWGLQEVSPIRVDLTELNRWIVNRGS